MTASTPLDGQDRDLLASGALSVRQLAEHFESTPGIIKRVQRQIHEGLPLVYLCRPLRGRQKVKYRYCKEVYAAPKEVQESALGLDHVAACKRHLADLRRVYPQLRGYRS